METSDLHTDNIEQEMSGWERLQRIRSDLRVKRRIEELIKNKSLSVCPDWITRRRRPVLDDDIFRKMTKENRSELALLLGIASYNNCRSEVSDAVRGSDDIDEIISEVNRIVAEHK